MSILAICLETSWDSIGAMLMAMQRGTSVCMMSMRWPAAQIEHELSRLGINQIVTNRTDLVTEQIRPSHFLKKSDKLTRIQDLHPKARTILHTSGSSSRPKAVVHSIKSHVLSANRAISKLNLGSSDRWLLSLPLWHVSGMSIVFRCLIANAKIILPDSSLSLLESLSDHQITHVSMVATQLMKFMDEPPPASLRAAIIGGGPTPRYVLKRALNNGWPIRTTYGMTETSSMVTLSNDSSQIGSSGRVLPGNELRIASDGEILVRSPMICAGYLNEGKIEGIIDQDGWLHTGDLGELNSSGELIVKSRKDSMFISGGENISPEEIERVIYESTRVQEAMVIPVPDDKFGQRPVAFIRGCTDFEGLSRFLEKNLPNFKVPICYSWPDHNPSTSIKRDRKSWISLALQLQSLTDQPAKN